MPSHPELDRPIGTDKSTFERKKPLQPHPRSGIVIVLELELVLGSLFPTGERIRLGLIRGAFSKDELFLSRRARRAGRLEMLR
jgi:hypothetical protein